jgi:hypothetical protein
LNEAAWQFSITHSHAAAALTFGIPIISVTIDDAAPHLLRGRYRPRRAWAWMPWWSCVSLALSAKHISAVPSVEDRIRRIAAALLDRGALTGEEIFELSGSAVE